MLALCNMDKPILESGLNVVCTPKKIKRHLTPQSSARKSKRQLTEPPESQTSRERMHEKEHLQSNSMFDELSDEMSNDYKEFVQIASDRGVLDKLFEFKILYYFRLFLVS